MKASKKSAKKLADRISAYEKGVSRAKGNTKGFKKPGSQNVHK